MQATEFLFVPSGLADIAMIAVEQVGGIVYTTASVLAVFDSVCSAGIGRHGGVGGDHY